MLAAAMCAQPCMRAAARGRPPGISRIWRSPPRSCYVHRMNTEQIVRDFCATAGRRDVQGMLAFFTDDAVYHNIPMEPATGRAAIESLLAQFVGSATELEFELLAIAVQGNKVLTERMDRMVMNGSRIEIPVMGTFEISSDGKISAWRDYFDMQQFMSQMG
jgi:limonene-1,2-epoxide hydrolase